MRPNQRKNGIIQSYKAKHKDAASPRRKEAWPIKTKRCTNSSCRRVFKVDSLTCPHCGKKYPRVNLHDQFAVVLTYTGPSKLNVVKAIRRYTGLRLYYAKPICDHAPSLITTGFRLSQAETLKAAVRAAGGDVMIVPANRKLRGIFVLPEKAG